MVGHREAKFGDQFPNAQALITYLESKRKQYSWRSSLWAPFGPFTLMIGDNPDEYNSDEPSFSDALVHLRCASKFAQRMGSAFCQEFDAWCADVLTNCKKTDDLITRLKPEDFVEKN